MLPANKSQRDSGGREHNGERSLCAAIIERAILDLSEKQPQMGGSNPRSLKVYRERDRERARRFFEGRRFNGADSTFAMCCEALGVDQGRLRRHVLSGQIEEIAERVRAQNRNYVVGPAVTKKIPESKTTPLMLEMLLKAGFYVWRNNSGVMRAGGRFIRFGFPGSSDIIGLCPNGLFFALENKTNGEPLKKNQEEFLADISRRGGITIIAHSVDDVARFLAEDQRSWGLA